MPPLTVREAKLTTSLMMVGLTIVVCAGLYLVKANLFLGAGAENEKEPANAIGPATVPPVTASGGGSSIPSDPDDSGKKQREDRAKREEMERQQEAARLVPLRARLAALKADGDSVREALTRFDSLTTLWKSKYEPLRTDDSGRRIAASPTHLVLALTVFGRERISDRQRAGWDEQLNQLLTPAADRDLKTPVVVSDDTLALMTRLMSTVKAAVKDLESDAAVLESAKLATASMTPSSDTLAQALEKRTIAEKTAELTRVEEGRKAALKKQADELAAIEQKKIDAETVIKKSAALVELQKIEYEKKQAELALKAAEDKRKADLAKAQLLTEYEKDLPTIKATLPAFITSGKSYRQKASNGPLSLAYIQGKGALEDSKTGMREFCRIAREINDRPAGPIPQFSGSEFSWQQLDKDAVRKAQNLIIKYGTIMVEKGLLDP
jgi:hypothetical protein